MSVLKKMRSLRREDCHQTLFFLQKTTRLIYYLNRAEHVLTRHQRYRQHLSNHSISLGTQERILTSVVSQIWLAGRENPGGNAVLFRREAKAQELLVLHTVGRDLSQNAVLAFVIEQDDTNLSAEQPGNLARQQLADLADLGASTHHQRDMVQAAQPFDLLLQLQSGFVDSIGELTDFIPAIDLDGLDDGSQPQVSGEIFDLTQRSDHRNQKNGAADACCREQ